MRLLAMMALVALTGCGAEREVTEEEPNASEQIAETNTARPDFASARPVDIQDTQMAADAEEIAKEAVRSRLRDPASAQFADIRTFAKGGKIVVCGRVNSKNGFGGMSGSQRFVSGGDQAFLEEEMAQGAIEELWVSLCTA